MLYPRFGQGHVLLRNSPLTMSSSQKHPFSWEQSVQLRELLWPAQGGHLALEGGGWGPGVSAAARELRAG